MLPVSGFGRPNPAAGFPVCQWINNGPVWLCAPHTRLSLLQGAYFLLIPCLPLPGRDGVLFSFRWLMQSLTRKVMAILVITAENSREQVTPFLGKPWFSRSLGFHLVAVCFLLKTIIADYLSRPKKKEQKKQILFVRIPFYCVCQREERQEKSSLSESIRASLYVYSVYEG